MNGSKRENAASSGGAFPIESVQEGQLAALVTALSDATNGLRRQTHECPTRQPLPSRDAVTGIVEALRTVLFPGYFGPSELTDENLSFHIGSTLDRVYVGFHSNAGGGRGVVGLYNNETLFPGSSTSERQPNLAQLLAERDRMLQEIERLAAEIAAAVREVAEAEEQTEKETDE